MVWRKSIATNWNKLRGLSRPELLVLLQAATLFPAVTLVQRFSTVSRLHDALSRLSNVRPSEGFGRGKGISAGNITRLVQIAARRSLARPSCLHHSFVLWTLLRRHGYDAAIHFGVRKSDGPALEAHAWVEHNGRVLNDTEDVSERFAPFPRPVLSDQTKAL